MPGHAKPHLPTKPCAACGRPFAWRRKWARDWDAVRYCSEACRSGRRAQAIARPSGRLDRGSGRG
ncbi:DUF2256 domain-containing protein [Roseomonas sp. AR75]|uniref:DUF2256 domain-containing protein n=1 Tax=Roseomonas sp. AR75 TaxID=2562311 RepID=UPI0010BFB25A|nr:DUF2256 domain-containing protein [Roseomonas sp. AR75]